MINQTSTPKIRTPSDINIAIDTIISRLEDVLYGRASWSQEHCRHLNKRLDKLTKLRDRIASRMGV